MSVTDDMRVEANGPPSAPSQRDGQFDRTPPQDIAAEQCVLGGMLLSKDAIADVVEILKAHDFYRPIHATIFDTILELYGRGEPADSITVAAALADSGDLVRIGGAPYLHTLIASVPTAANAAYYARIVAERAVLRRLVEAGTKIVQLGYGTASGGSRDVDDVVDLAQQAVYDVTERRVSEDFAVLADMLQPTLDEIEAVGAQGGVMTGVPTGFTDLDRLLNGLHPGQLIIVAGRPGLGKALALDTPLPTPDGWTTMAEVRVGDRLLGADGRPTSVSHVFDVMRGRPCYAVEFSDGSVIVADGAHLWKTRVRDDEHHSVRTRVSTTAQIAAALRHPGATRATHAVQTCRPIQLPHREDLPVAPYALGVRLAGAPAAPTSGASDDPHVPVAYLRAAEEQRRDLLAGLLDTAGTLTVDGQPRFTTAARTLAEDVHELVVGLGYPATIRVRTQGGSHDAPPRYVVDFRTPDKVFRSSPRLAEQRLDLGPDAVSRAIVDVRPVPSVPVRCVAVDNADHLYLAGRAMIPTHNSTASMDFARNAAIRANQASAIFSLEMSKVEIVMRLLSAEARVPLHILRSGQLSDDDWTKLARCMGEISDAPLFVDDTPSMNLMEIRAKARRLRQRHDLKLIVVDYLQLMTSPKRTESRQQEVADLSRGLKLLAKEVECPVIAVSQLNRGPEQRTDKRPQLSDLRESGCLTADTTLLRADTGAPITFADLLRDGYEGVSVWSLDDDRRMVPAPITNVFPSGTKQTYRLVVESGRDVKASGNHPFLTAAGWRALDDLRVGDRIAVPRRVPEPMGVRRRPEAEIDTLVHLLSLPSHEGGLPDGVFALPDDQVAGFLGRLWAKRGDVVLPEGGSAATVHYSSTNRGIADGVMALLARFGIVATRETVTGVGGRTSFRVTVTDAASLRTFCRDIGVHGARGEHVAQVHAHVAAGDPDVVDAADDVIWDRIVAIESLGEHPVYDATVKGTHNFVADGIVAHNSIEQDADVVILLHRDDYYDKESPRAGEADFIVAKHRNGPTDTVTVAAQLHLSRFVDMAIV